MTLLSIALLPNVQAAQVKIVGVESKSYYNENGVAYHHDNVKDGKSTPPWFEGDSGNGVGSWIEVDLGDEHQVTEVRMLAGDWTSGDHWTKANRPAEVEVRWSDGSTDIWTLADEWQWQSFKPKSPKATSKIRLKFNSLHSGSAFPDTAISELQVFDDSTGKEVVPASATASTTYPSDNSGAYEPIYAYDGVKDTMWCEGNKEGDGVGEWIEFDLGSAVTLLQLKVCAGMCAGLDIFKKGNATTKLTVDFGNGHTQQFPLKDFPLPQPLRPSSPQKTSKVKLRIDEVRAGSEYNDACISEVSFIK